MSFAYWRYGLFYYGWHHIEKLKRGTHAAVVVVSEGVGPDLLLDDLSNLQLSLLRHVPLQPAEEGNGPALALGSRRLPALVHRHLCQTLRAKMRHTTVSARELCSSNDRWSTCQTAVIWQARDQSSHSKAPQSDHVIKTLNECGHAVTALAGHSSCCSRNAWPPSLETCSIVDKRDDL